MVLEWSNSARKSKKKKLPKVDLDDLGDLGEQGLDFAIFRPPRLPEKGRYWVTSATAIHFLPLSRYL